MSKGTSVVKIVLLVLGTLFLGMVAVVVALGIWIHAETNGVDGPDDGGGGVVVYEDSDYTPPPDPTP